MFNIGLFSYHLPYLVLVLSYLTCWGYYSFNKKDVEAEETNIEYFESEKSNQATSFLFQDECTSKRGPFYTVDFTSLNDHFFPIVFQEQAWPSFYVLQQVATRYLITILSRPPPVEV